MRRIAFVATRLLNLLLNRAWDDFRPLVEAAKAEDLIYAGGMLRVFRTDQAFEGMKARELDLMDYTKRSYELLNADEIRQMEPALVDLPTCDILDRQPQYPKSRPSDRGLRRSFCRQAWCDRCECRYGHRPDE